MASLETAIEQLLKRARRKKRPALVAPAEGCSESQILERETQLGRPIPRPVRTLLRHVSPATWQLAYSAIPGQDDLIRLYSIDECMWADASNFTGCVIREHEELPKSWRSVELFGFATGIYGDEILFCPEHPEFGRNCILMADHESDEGVVVLGRSLPDWINRLNKHGVDYVYAPGAVHELSKRERVEFLKAQRRVNPHLEWPAEMLFRSRYPKGHPRGVHVWDHKAQKMRPIADVRHKDSVYLENPSLKDLQSLLKAPWLSHISIDGGQVSGISLLAQLPGLEYVSFRATDPVKVEALDGCRRLKKLAAYDTTVSGLDALVAIASLQQLEVAQAKYRLKELKSLHRMRPKVYIDVIDELEQKARRRRRQRRLK